LIKNRRRKMFKLYVFITLFAVVSGLAVRVNTPSSLTNSAVIEKNISDESISVSYPEIDDILFDIA